MTKKLAVTLGLVVFVGSLPAYAQKPEALVEQRQAAFTLMGKYFGTLSGMVKNKTPYDAAIAARSAAYLEVLTQLPWDGFQPSTADFPNTEAKPEIYKDKAKFDGYAKDLQTAAAKLAQVSKSGGLEALKPAFADMGKACKTCHDAFQKD